MKPLAANPAATDAATGTTVRRNASRALTGSLALACCWVLAACSSGSGGKDVTIGSGQNADPVTLDFPVFYVKRPVPDPDDEDTEEADARIVNRFEIGADLFMRDRATPSAPEVNLTFAQTAGLGDIRDVAMNFDGTKVVFSMRARFIEGADEEDQPTWNIWEYDVETQVLRRLMTDDTAEEGHDIMPQYLPDGRIVFSSTRQQDSRAIQLDENKPQYAGQVERTGGNLNPAFVLHVMDKDGTRSSIHQLTFNQSHDLYPSVMNDGRIVFTHWEHALDDDQMDIYTVNPDGSNLQLLYGNASHNTGTVNPTTGLPSVVQFLNPRAMPDGRTLAVIRPFTGTSEGGDLVLIDAQHYVECNQGVPTTTVSAPPPCAAQARALPTDVRTIPGPSPGGRYRSAAPLFDGTNRLLVSWSQCRLMEGTRIVPCTSDRLADPNAVEAPPLYGVYIYDVNENTQKPIVPPEEGFILTEVVAGSLRTLPPVILDRVPAVDFPAELVSDGILDIRSVYDFDGVDSLAGTASGSIANVRNPANAAYATRPARFLRIEKVVANPDDDTRDVPNTAYGPLGRGFGMRDILGYAPIEPDGSVKVRVPANVAFAISILDKDGRRIVSGLRHTNWLQVKPGETVKCNGCHTTTVNANNPLRSHGREGLFTSVNAGAPTTGTPFPNTTPLLAPFDMGETMAQARARAMCGPTGACAPSVNIVFDDFWPANPAQRAPSYDMCYQTGSSGVVSDPADPAARHVCMTNLNTPPPLSQLNCNANWNSLCRITIHYQQHIHPLWSVNRQVLDSNNVVVADHTCNTCHSQVNPVDSTVQVPQGQLDLSDGVSDDEPDHFRAYRELLFQDNAQINNNGTIEDELVQVGVDPVTNLPQFATVPVAASMSAGGARASTRFFNKFDLGTGPTDHRGWLTPAELRLLAEWLDIGAQYYNDPFVAPEN